MSVYVAVAVLNYNQRFTQEDLFKRIPQGAIPWPFMIDHKGIGGACNIALHWAFELNDSPDYCLIMANDIIEPQEGIRLRLDKFGKHPDAGIIAMPCGRVVHEQSMYLAGNFMISRKVFEKIGYFTTAYDAAGYGPVDLEYALRSHLAGFRNYNIMGIQAKHLDNGDQAYGFSKKGVLKQKTWGMFTRRKDYLTSRNHQQIANGALYLPFDQ